MIIKDIKELRKVPIGEKVTLILDFQVVKTDLNAPAPCDGCILRDSGCDNCSGFVRDDGDEVKFIKI